LDRVCRRQAEGDPACDLPPFHRLPEGGGFKGLPELLYTDCPAGRLPSEPVRCVLEALSWQGTGPGLKNQSSMSDAILVLKWLSLAKAGRLPPPADFNELAKEPDARAAVSADSAIPAPPRRVDCVNKGKGAGLHGFWEVGHCVVSEFDRLSRVGSNPPVDLVS
jgi:hypothetical protein